jgi:putative transposase
VESASATSAAAGDDRIFWIILSRLWKNWRSSLQVVRPETVVRWHRQGFKRYWT